MCQPGVFFYFSYFNIDRNRISSYGLVVFNLTIQGCLRRERLLASAVLAAVEQLKLLKRYETQGMGGHNAQKAKHRSAVPDDEAVGAEDYAPSEEPSEQEVRP